MTAPPLVHVVDDDESLRSALLLLLATLGFEARGYGSAGEFLLHPLPDRPGCLLLDLRLPGPSGIDLQAALSERGSALPVIFLSGEADVPASVQAMKGGAVDFLVKPFERQALVDALQRALARDAAARFDRARASELQARFATLTSREREVLELVVAGRLNKQIAGRLGIAERTVKAVRAAVLAKMEVGSAAELGALAERLRIRPPGGLSGA